MSINNKINSIIKRVKRNNGVGIIYNISSEEQKSLKTEFGKDDGFYTIDGAGLFTSYIFIKRIGREFNVKGKPHFSMLPALIKNRMIVLTNCDTYTPSFSDILAQLKNYRIPLFLFMSSEAPLNDLRRLPSYRRILSIEQDFKKL